MKKILIPLLCVALVVVAALVVHAQGPGFHARHHGFSPDGEMSEHFEHMEHMVGFLTKALDLTDDQQAAAKQLHEEIAEKAKPLFEQIHQQWEDIHSLLEKGNANPTELGQKVIAAHAAREQLGALHEDAMTKFKALLNPQQVEKLSKLHEMHGERGPFGRHSERER